METLSYPSTPPQIQTSHMRHTPQQQQPHPTSGVASLSRAALDDALDQHDPASQESSTSSNGSSVRVPSSSQYPLQEDISPISSTSTSQLSQITTDEPATKSTHISRHRTPDNLVQPSQAPTPATTTPAPSNKRTANGHIKAPSLTSLPLTYIPNPARSRSHSSSTTSTTTTTTTTTRAGELAQQLKQRLGYAMQKVQYGLADKSLAEVEALRQRPMSSGLSSPAARLSMHDPYAASNHGSYSEQQARKRRSGNWSQTTTTPRLQPAAELRPRSYHAGTYYSSSQRSSNGNSAMSPPRTPIYDRPTTIRTTVQTAEAEREALQALFELGSPQLSQNGQGGWEGSPVVSQRSAWETSPPSRVAEFTPRRVAFARGESVGGEGGAG